MVSSQRKPDGRLERGRGPAHPVAARPGVGYTSAQPWAYDVESEPLRRMAFRVDGTGLVGRVIDTGDVLDYAVHPVFDGAETDVRDSYAATAVSLELVFEDGTTLSETGAVDQYGVTLDPQAQFDARMLAVDQWSHRTIGLTGLAGRRVEQVWLRIAVPLPQNGNRTARRIVGYLDSIRIRRRAPRPTEPVDWVSTTRGTQSSDRFSRGNCAPLVAPPHGFVFGLPMTDAGNRGWPYSYHEAVDDTATGHLQAFATSHIPSPWMGDRGVLQFFPSPEGRPDLDPRARQLSFSHDDEVDRPDLYAVTLGGGVQNGGLDVELTAGVRSVWMRTRFPHNTGSIILDMLGSGEIILPERPDWPPVHGHVDDPGGLVESVPRMFFVVRTDVPIAWPVDGSSGSRAGLGFRLPADRTVTFAVGVSFISVEQAERNLDFDIDSAGAGFDAIHAQTRAAWQRTLGRLDVEGATDDQLTTLYSNLHRVHLYPTIAHENIGTADEPRWAYADPFRRVEPKTRFDLDRRVVDGKLTVTDGFWDSYRASWPLRTLIRPDLTGELLDGFVEHFRTGGWVSRWSAPGPADIMTGTSSDAVFADAVLAGVDGLDVVAAYDSCLRNATTPSENPHVGRKGMARSMFRGYTDNETFEGMSWTVDAAINDAAIAAFSRHLADTRPDDPRIDEYRDNAVWFAARAAGYANVFDGSTGFFRGRERSGEFRPANEFDPRNWGLDYTETNAWGTAFTAPHDGAGLAALHGGREALGDKLDRFCAQNETGRDEFRGWYPVVIHEMREARDTRMGMLALSNQPAHHIPFMYAHTGRHHRTQELVRDAVGRLFTGSDAGQGYPGDEDNGEMSAWYLLAASGIYPLSVGSGEFVLTAPSFRRITWTLDNGAQLRIDAPEVSADNVYIQAVRLDGEPWPHITVPRDRLASGAHLRFDLGPEPSSWAQDSVPASFSDIDGPRPPRDLTAPTLAPRAATGVPDAASAFDDDSATPAVALAPGQWIEWDFAAPTAVDHYTVTPARTGRHAWVLEARESGVWVDVDRRDVDFRWDRQTRVFAVRAPADFTAYRVRAESPLELAQLEYLRLSDG